MLKDISFISISDDDGDTEVLVAAKGVDLNKVDTIKELIVAEQNIAATYMSLNDIVAKVFADLNVGIDWEIIYPDYLIDIE